MLNLILPFLTGIIPDVLKRVLPAEKISEADRANLEQQLTCSPDARREQGRHRCCEVMK